MSQTHQLAMITAWLLACGAPKPTSSAAPASREAVPAADPASAPPPLTPERAVTELDRFADRMCACNTGTVAHDRVCVERVQSDFEAWMKNASAELGNQIEQDPALQKRAESILAKLMSCVSQAVAPDPSTTDDPCAGP